MTELSFLNLIIQQASAAQSGMAVKACDTILRLAIDRRNVIGIAKDGDDEQRSGY